MKSIFWMIFSSLVLTGIEVNCRELRSSIEFEGKNIRPNLLFDPINRYEYAERNTSEEYGFWDEAGVKWVEWPGNITNLDVAFPILKWSKKRAKFIKNPCNHFLGMNFFAYAYKHLHLTFGPYRITTSYCPPISIPRKILPESDFSLKSKVIAVSDFEFVPNYLLVILENRVVVRIGPLEKSYRTEASMVDPEELELVSYTVANGITLPVDKLVTQNCCNRHDICKSGDLVLAYKERSTTFAIFISIDSGENFSILYLSKRSSILHGVLSYPSLNKLLAFHGNETTVSIDAFSIKTGRIFENNSTTNSQLKLRGQLQVAKFGQEMSFLIWDQCRVWYSFNSGKSLTKANFYVNSAIRKDAYYLKKHLISPKHCLLAQESAVAYDDTGKVGLLDSNNNHFYGIDTKSTTFTLIASKLDLSLMTGGTQNSIVPYFDFNNRLKLMYPPRFLRVSHPAVQNPNYQRRLAMRLFPKTIFPSDFMQPFYTEHIPKPYKYMGIQMCESTGLHANSSISQKPKIYTISEHKHVNFFLQFRSTSNSSHQLKFEPSQYSQFLRIKLEIVDFVPLGFSRWYYFKYRVSVEPRSPVRTDVNYRINFYAKKSIRCAHQPQLTVWINVVNHTNLNSEAGTNNIFAADNVRVAHGYLTSESVVMSENPMKISSCGLRDVDMGKK